MKVGLQDSLTEERLLAILKLYGFSTDDAEERFSYENFIYIVKHQERSYFMRISHSKYNNLNNIQAELDWIKYLDENSVTVVTPVPSLSRNHIEQVKFKDFSFIIVVFNFIEGENFTENIDLLTPEKITKWGQLVAKLHKLSMTYKLKDSRNKRPNWDEEPLFKNIDITLDQFPVVLSNAKKYIQLVRELPTDPTVFGLIHQDLHESNVILKDNKMTIIDFDDCHYSWYVEDIAIIMFHYAWRFESTTKSRQDLIDEFYPIFIKGYLSMFPLDKIWIDRIQVFVKLRHYRLFCTLAYELKIEEDEWSRKILNYWKPMLENDENWIMLDHLNNEI